jgi:ribulose-5-phosphate 4-epimerase/fuculose-1-phosphate aldolase
MGHAEIARPARFSEIEWAARLQLASCYQLFEFMGWSETIFNHISLRIPGPEHHFLVNPFGLGYDEVTASNLVTVDLQGRNVEPGPYQGNIAGFALHGVIHEHRKNAMCVIHTHTTAGMAVACKEGGLRHQDFYGAILYGRIAYHEFEGITIYDDERPRMLASLGDKDFLILRNHGLVALGPSLPQAVVNYWTLQRACEVQVATESMQGATHAMAQSVQAKAGSDAAKFDATGQLAPVFYDALVRRMERARAARGQVIDWRA